MKKQAFIHSLLGSICLIMNSSSLKADSPFDFELDFGQQMITLEGDTELEAKTFGIKYTEYAGQPLALQLSLGYSDFDHSGDATATNYSPTGHYAGVSAKLSTSEENRFRAGLDLSYTYFEGNDESDDPDILELRWTQAEAKLWLSIGITSHLDVYGCASALNLNGKQKLKGATPLETDLEIEKKNGHCGGLKYTMPDNGYVGLDLNGGSKEGGRIYFGKRFN